MTYAEKLAQTKSEYPFDKWREAFDSGLEQYTAENCGQARKIFDDLIEDLIAKGEAATENEKIESFKTAILALNRLNDECDGELIETDEREDLWMLTNIITVTAGLNPTDYGEGEGLVTEWREW